MSLFVEREGQLGAGLDLDSPYSPLAPYFFSPGAVVAVVIIAAVFAFLNFVPLGHTDVWGHLKYGDVLVESRQFLRGETTCAFTDPPDSVVNCYWLSQVLFATFFRAGQLGAGTDALAQLAGGADGLRLLHSLLVSLRLILLYIAFRRLARSSMLAALGIAFVVVISFGSLGVLRPQVIAELLLAALLVPLSRWHLSNRAIILIPLIMIDWANTHGSYPLGLIILLTIFGCRLMELLFERRSSSTSFWHDKELTRLGWASFLSLLGIILINPEGYRIFLGTMAMARHPNVRQMDEWQPLWSDNLIVARILFGICMALMLAAFIAAKGRFRLATWALLALFAGQAILHQRGLVWLFSMVPWLAMPYFGNAWLRFRPSNWVAKLSFRKTLIAGMAAIVALMWSLPAQRLFGTQKTDVTRSLSDGTPWAQAFAIAQPVAVPDNPLSKAIASTFPDGRFLGTIYTGDTLGDFFVWRLASPAPVYMYSHVHLFSEDQWHRFTTIRDGKTGWRQELDRAGVNVVIARPAVEPGICQRLRGDSAWSVITDETNMATKRDPRHRLLVAVRKQPLAAASKPE